MAVADALIAVVTNLWFAFLGFLPQMVAALLLLAVGYVVAWILGAIVAEIFTRLDVDKYVRKEAHIKVRLSSLADVVIRWVVYLVFIQSAAGVLGVVALADFVGRIIAFVPELIKAGIVILAAYAVGIYFKEEVIASRSLYSRLTGKIIFFLTMYLGLSVALNLIRIPLIIVDQILIILVASLGLGLAIALGLGLKDAVADIASGYAQELKNKRR